VVLAGEPAVGKTTLKERLVTGQFATPKSTRGLELGTNVMDHPTVKGARITLNFWVSAVRRITARPSTSSSPKPLSISSSGTPVTTWRRRASIAGSG
jgi:GTPase SAR1 family protein